MAIPFGIYNLGNSGGSWLESVIRSKPGCYAWEEVRRDLNLPKMGDGMTGEEVQARIFAFFKEQCERDDLQACGLIKGFRIDVAEYIAAQGGRFLQHVRNPIRHLQGTYKRSKGAENGLGRKPENEEEYFLGQVLWQSSRYRKYLRRAETIPLIRLEDLSYSLRDGCGIYFMQVLSYITQVEWTHVDAFRVVDKVPPRNQAYLPRFQWFTDIPSKNDPSANDIWESWTSSQRGVFLKHYETIMLTLGYAIPEV